MEPPGSLKFNTTETVLQFLVRVGTCLGLVTAGYCFPLCQVPLTSPCLVPSETRPTPLHASLSLSCPTAAQTIVPKHQCGPSVFWLPSSPAQVSLWNWGGWNSQAQGLNITTLTGNDQDNGN